MFGTDIISKILGGFAIVSGSLLLGYWYGDSYGSSAWKLAAIKTELAQTNSELSRLQAEDAVTAAAEWDRASREDADFSKVAPSLKKCLLDSAQVAALNKITGGR